MHIGPGMPDKHPLPLQGHTGIVQYVMEAHSDRMQYLAVICDAAGVAPERLEGLYQPERPTFLAVVGEIAEDEFAWLRFGILNEVRNVGVQRQAPFGSCLDCLQLVTSANVYERHAAVRPNIGFPELEHLAHPGSRPAQQPQCPHHRLVPVTAELYPLRPAQYAAQLGTRERLSLAFCDLAVWLDAPRRVVWAYAFD